MAIPLILLAAGESQRMGQPKGLVTLGDHIWLQLVVQDARASGVVSRIIVVTGSDSAAYAQAIAAHRIDVEQVVNPDPARGPFSSLQVGLGAALTAGESDVFVLPIDVPPAGSSVWERLYEAVGHEAAAVPSVEERGGHPVALSGKLATQITAMDPSGRLDHVLKQAKATRVYVGDARVCMNLNTPEAFTDYASKRGAAHGTDIV